MPEEFIKFLAMVGGVAIIGIIIFFIMILKEVIGDAIDKAKLKYKRKHRFDKPPIAKCYCIDCRYYSKETKECHMYSDPYHGCYYMAPEWFCAKGEPKGYE